MTDKTHAICPECEQTVEIRKSACRCENCRNNYFYKEHLNKEKTICFGSGHGVKERKY